MGLLLYYHFLLSYGLLVPDRVNTSTIKALVNWLELKDMFVIGREVKDSLSWANSSNPETQMSKTRKYETDEQLVPAEKRPWRGLCKCSSHRLSKNPNSAQAHVCAHSLWSPFTIYYSFPDITCGSWPYFQRVEGETSLRSIKQQDEK